MLRSLGAVIVAVIIGLTAAKFVESAAAALLVGDGARLGADIGVSPAYQAILVFCWLVGAFVAAGASLLMGKRWAPLGWLGAATIFFSAMITLITFSLSWLLWPASLTATAAGGYVAVKLFNATRDYPASNTNRDVFSD